MPETEVYLLPKRRTLFYLAGACFLTAAAPLILHIIFTGKYTGNSGEWVPFSSIWAVLAVATYLQAKLTTLVISNEGLKISGVLLRSEVNWSDISQVFTKKNFILFFLSTPAKPLNLFTQWCYRKKLISADVASINDFYGLWKNGTLEKKFSDHNIPINKLEENTKFPSFHKN